MTNNTVAIGHFFANKNLLLVVFLEKRITEDRLGSRKLANF